MSHRVSFVTFHDFFEEGYCPKVKKIFQNYQLRSDFRQFFGSFGKVSVKSPN